MSMEFDELVKARENPTEETQSERIHYGDGIHVGLSV
jgi:hypothetical protein